MGSEMCIRDRGLDGQDDETAGRGQQGEDDDDHQLVLGGVLLLFVVLEALAELIDVAGDDFMLRDGVVQAGLQHFEAGGVAVDLVADVVGNGVAIGLVEVAQVIEEGWRHRYNQGVWWMPGSDQMPAFLAWAMAWAA